MTNNDVLRRLRFTFNFKEQTIASICLLAGRKVTNEQITAWLLKEDEQGFVPMSDAELASFLDGFIIDKRGAKQGVEKPVLASELNKNAILQKLKIALSLTNDDIIDLLKKENIAVGKSELSAFFRKADHKNYRQCKAQFLRNFLMALQNQYRGKVTKSVKPTKSPKAQAKSVESAATPKQIYVNPKAVKSAKDKPRKVLSIKAKK